LDRTQQRIDADQNPMTTPASSAYPSLIPTAPVGNGNGLPALRTVVSWDKQFSDQSIKGAYKINPAYAGDMIAGRYKVDDTRPGSQEPLEVKDKLDTQSLATGNSPNAWKRRPLSAMANAILFGGGKPQKPNKLPWVKKLIPPLALFNDASQWVNVLMFNRPMQKSGNGNSMPNLKAQYFTPPPIITANLAAGTLNAQLQLGSMAIQATQLTISASNYFGGS
jgi:hypothetical protein